MKYVVPEDRTPPIYYRWIHELYINEDSKYIFKVRTGEETIIDSKILGDIEELDAGEMLFNLSKLYISTYLDRLRSIDAYSEESFNIEDTVKRLYSEIYRSSSIPTRVVLLETLRDHGDFRELNQSVLHVNWIYIMSFN
ncbi:MAG: hypothetical protein QXQ57_06425 [Sulfolobales archaeon]